jgi:hypothetical protein
MSFRAPQICSITWDMTVGAGVDTEQKRHPQPDDVARAQESFGCDFTPEQKQFFLMEWARCIQEMEFP